MPSRRSALGSLTSSGNSTDVASRSSRPTMWPNSSAASVTSRVSGPAWSSDDANAIIPKRLHDPYVGLRPTIPHSAAGWRIEPPVSVPTAHGAVRAATAAAEPPLDPPGTRLRSHGLRTGPYAEFSFDEPIANSSWFVLQSSGEPASASLRT